MQIYIKNTKNPDNRECCQGFELKISLIYYYPKLSIPKSNTLIRLPINLKIAYGYRVRHNLLELDLPIFKKVGKSEDSINLT